MKFYINQLTINGIKSIDKPITLNFTNLTIRPNMNNAGSNVMAIYGPNGSGKSGIITAMYIYKRIIEDKAGITDGYFSKFIYSSINQSLKKMNIEVIFSCKLNKKIPTNLKHIIELVIKEEEICISKEEILINTGRTIKENNFESYIKVENGKLLYINDVDSNSLKENPIYIASFNLLEKNSIVSCLSKIPNNVINDYLGNKNGFVYLLMVAYFSREVVVELNKEDTHMSYISNKLMLERLVKENSTTQINDENKDSYIDKVFYLSTQNSDIVKVEDYDSYSEYISDLTKFIKIFKPSLDEIVIDKKINANEYYCKKIFKYGEMEVDLEFESTGIKKIIRIYSALKSCANGKITFIDEMDANLHDVYFTKLIEFFKNDAYGQLCFTTHNLKPIEILKDNKHALVFLSNDSRIYSWTKDGNKSPMTKYINGLIPYSPFLVESFDFDVLLDGGI